MLVHLGIQFKEINYRYTLKDGKLNKIHLRCTSRSRIFVDAKWSLRRGSQRRCKLVFSSDLISHLRILLMQIGFHAGPPGRYVSRRIF